MAPPGGSGGARGVWGVWGTPQPVLGGGFGGLGGSPGGSGGVPRGAGGGQMGFRTGNHAPNGLLGFSVPVRVGGAPPVPRASKRAFWRSKTTFFPLSLSLEKSFLGMVFSEKRSKTRVFGVLDGFGEDIPGQPNHGSAGCRDARALPGTGGRRAARGCWGRRIYERADLLIAQ